MEGHAASVLCLEVCDDRMVSGSLGGEVMMWSLLSAANTLSTFAEHGTAVNALAWERNLVFCAADKNVQVKDSVFIAQPVFIPQPIFRTL